MPRGTETLTVKPQVKVDKLRSSTAEAPATYEVTGCLSWPRSSLEEGKGWVGIDGRSVKCPPGTDIPRTARVVLSFDGLEYEVDGTPQDFGRKGVIVQLTRVS